RLVALDVVDLEHDVRVHRDPGQFGALGGAEVHLAVGGQCVVDGEDVRATVGDGDQATQGDGGQELQAARLVEFGDRVGVHGLILPPRDRRRNRRTGIDRDRPHSLSATCTLIVYSGN